MNQKFHAHLRAPFLAALVRGLTAQEAADSVGLGRSTAYDHRKRDASFRGAWDQAVEAGSARLASRRINDTDLLERRKRMARLRSRRNSVRSQLMLRKKLAAFKAICEELGINPMEILR